MHALHYFYQLEGQMDKSHWGIDGLRDESAMLANRRSPKAITLGLYSQSALLVTSFTIRLYRQKPWIQVIKITFTYHSDLSFSIRRNYKK